MLDQPVGIAQGAQEQCQPGINSGLLLPILARRVYLFQGTPLSLPVTVK